MVLTVPRKVEGEWERFFAAPRMKCHGGEGAEVVGLRVKARNDCVKGRWTGEDSSLCSE